MPRVNILHILFFGVLMMRFVTSCDSCGPGQTGFKRSGPPKKYLNRPLRLKESVPLLNENSQRASGPAFGKIHRKERKFKKYLVRVNTTNIVFRDEERTGADRYMTRRCREKLLRLGVMVQNEWPEVKLYVTEAYDENFAHKKRSLHYEGRAIDIKTDDRDRKKYGMLARLAVDAGFDWVYYESKAYIHVSCKADGDRHLRDERCFHADSSFVVRKSHHAGGALQTIPMRDLQLGDQVLATDFAGNPVFSEVISWLDVNLVNPTVFLRIETASRLNLTLTESHIINSRDHRGKITAVFSRDLVPGDSVIVWKNSSSTSEGPFYTDKIISITEFRSTGSLAPLTRHGTIVVNRIAASCYAVVPSTRLAHYAFAPLRWWTSILGISQSQRPLSDGIHPYARVLMILYNFFLTLPRDIFSLID